MHFIRFMFCLSVGLIGVCMVLKTIIDSLLADWDVMTDLRHAIKEQPHKIRRALEHGRRDHYLPPDRLTTRLDPYQRQSLPAPEVLAAEAE